MQDKSLMFFQFFDDMAVPKRFSNRFADIVEELKK